MIIQCYIRSKFHKLSQILKWSSWHIKDIGLWFLLSDLSSICNLKRFLIRKILKLFGRIKKCLNYFRYEVNRKLLNKISLKYFRLFSDIHCKTLNVHHTCMPDSKLKFTAHKSTVLVRQKIIFQK